MGANVSWGLNSELLCTNRGSHKSSGHDAEGNRAIWGQQLQDWGRGLCMPSSGPLSLSRGLRGHAWPREDSRIKQHLG